MFRQPRQHDEEHLAFLRELPCVACGDDTATEAAHIRYGWRPAYKRPAGLQEKSDDRWAIPLCGKCHREQHDEGERPFWQARGIDPTYVAMALILNTGDHEAGLTIVQENRERAPVYASRER